MGGRGVAPYAGVVRVSPRTEGARRGCGWVCTGARRGCGSHALRSAGEVGGCPLYGVGARRVGGARACFRAAGGTRVRAAAARRSGAPLLRECGSGEGGPHPGPSVPGDHGPRVLPAALGPYARPAPPPGAPRASRAARAQGPPALLALLPPYGRRTRRSSRPYGRLRRQLPRKPRGHETYRREHPWWQFGGQHVHQRRIPDPSRPPLPDQRHQRRRLRLPDPQPRVHLPQPPHQRGVLPPESRPLRSGRPLGSLAPLGLTGDRPPPRGGRYSPPSTFPFRGTSRRPASGSPAAGTACGSSRTTVRVTHRPVASSCTRSTT